LKKLYEIQKEAEEAGIPFIFEADAFIKNISVINDEDDKQLEYNIVNLYELDEEPSEEESSSEEYEESSSEEYWEAEQSEESEGE